jgi:hypothetical protein
MIDNVQSSQMAHATGQTTLPHPDQPGKPATNESDATVQVTFAALINQALQASETQPDAVQRARALLQSGQLTSLQNIRSAAQNIVAYGI